MSSSSKKKGMPPAHGSEVNVTPLIDVIMCLIIFFMLVAKIGVTDGVKIDKKTLPMLYLGKTIDDMGNTLSLNVMPLGNGDTSLNTDPQVTALVDGQEKDLPITAMQGNTKVFPLREVLMQMRERFTDKETKKISLKVIIHAQKDLPCVQVQKVMIECANAGTSNLNFAGQDGTEEQAENPTPAPAP